MSEQPTINLPDPDDILNPNVTPEAYIYKAKYLAAFAYFRSASEREEAVLLPSPDDFYITWFSKTLQNWKALVSTDIEPGLYWEITYDGNKDQSYVDAYVKEDNFCMTDEELHFNINLEEGGD